MADDQDTTDQDRAGAFSTALQALQQGWQGNPDATQLGAAGAASPNAAAAGFALGKAAHYVGNTVEGGLTKPLQLVPPTLGVAARGMGGVADYAGEKPIGDMLRAGANIVSPQQPPTLTSTVTPTPPSGGGAPAGGAGAGPPPGPQQPAAPGPRVPVRPGIAPVGMPGQAELAAANDAEQKAEQETANADKATNNALAPVQSQLANRQQQIATDVQARQAQVLQATQDRLQHLQKVADDFENADVDPQQYEKSLGGFDRVMAHISMALGGIGGALQGKGNTSPVVDRINQNIAQQTAKLERKKTAFDMNNTLVGQLFAQTKNLGEAATLAQDIYSKAAISKLEELKLQTANPKVQAIADQHIAQLKANRVQAAQKLTSDVADTNLKKAQTVDTYAGAKLKNAEAGKAALAAQNPQNMVSINGMPVRVRDAEEAQKISQMVTSGSAARGAVAANNKAQKGAGFFTKVGQALGFNTEAGASGALARDAFSANANQALGNPNAPNEQQMKSFKAGLDTPWSPDAGAKGGEEAVAGFRQALAARLVANGTSPQMARALAMQQYPALEGETSSIPGLQTGFR
jgi:hypothetical protein